MKAMVGQFAEMCRRRGMKVNDSKSKVIVLNGEEGLENVFSRVILAVKEDLKLDFSY